MNKFFRFLRERAGNVTITFALSSIPVFLSVGMAVDFVRGQWHETAVQNALDSGVLAAAREFQLNGGEKNDAITIGKKLFNSNLELQGIDSSVFKNPISYNNDGFDGEVMANIDTTFMALAGVPELKRPVLARSDISKRDLELVFVFDVSHSMEESLGGNTILRTMQDFAIDLTDNMSKNPSVGAFKAGLVPFSTTVNVGTANSSFVTGTNHSLFSSQPWAGCVFERAGNFAMEDFYDGGENSAGGKWHAYIAPPEPDAHTNYPYGPAPICMNPSDGTNNGYGPQSTWFENAVLSTGQDWNAADSLVIEGPNLNCTRNAIQSLTSDTSTFFNSVNALTAGINLGTAVAPGIAWGRRVLSPQAPFSEGASTTSNTKRVMIVLTDGEQLSNGREFSPGMCNASVHSSGANFSFDPRNFKLGGRALSGFGPSSLITPYGYLLDSDPFNQGISDWDQEDAELDRLMLAACDSVKDDSDGVEIDIFTIGISGNTAPGTRIFNLLTQCASSPSMFYQVENTAQISDAFDKILEQFVTISLAR